MHAPARPPEASGKIVPLEALRGMAAIGVVFHHFALGFLPRLINFGAPGQTEGLLVGSPLFLLAPGRRWWLPLALALLALLFFGGAIWFFPFLFGVLGVYLNLGRRVLGKGATALLLVLGLYLCGYYGPVGWYSWLSVPYQMLQDITLRVLIATLGGFLLLVVFATQNPVSTRFTGPLSRTLGSISFSLYLLHTLILASFCAWAYVRVGGATAGVLAAIAAFMITAPPLVVLLARFDRWWLKTLGRWHPLAGKKPDKEQG